MIRCFESFSGVSGVIDHLKILKSIFIDVENEFQVPVRVYYKEISDVRGSSFDYRTINIDGVEGIFRNTTYYAPYGYFVVSAYLPNEDRQRSQDYVDFSKSIYVNKCLSNLNKMNIEYSNLTHTINRELMSISFKLKSPIENDLSISAEDLEDLLIDYRDNDRKVLAYFTHDNTPKDINVAIWRIMSFDEDMEYIVKSLESRELEFYHEINNGKSVIDIVC